MRGTAKSVRLWLHGVELVCSSSTSTRQPSDPDQPQARSVDRPKVRGRCLFAHHQALDRRIFAKYKIDIGRRDFAAEHQHMRGAVHGGVDRP
jgi:hypothetical protein